MLILRKVIYEQDLSVNVLYVIQLDASDIPTEFSRKRCTVLGKDDAVLA